MRKSLEDTKRSVAERKDTVKRCLDEDQEFPSDLKKGALALSRAGDWDDEGAEYVTSHEDDEYRWAGVEDPKIVITTSRDPSSRLRIFAKEMKLVFPNSQRINRGKFDTKELIDACRANEVTDLILLSETRGNPDGIIICHLPYGPTAYFQLMNTVMRHDIPHLDTMSEAYPHLVFHGLSSKLGQRVTNIIKYLFPVPRPDSKRIITFANNDDFISFRHHNYKKNAEEGGDPNKHIELTEVGPRFEMKLYQIKLGTLEIEDTCETEWVLRPYMNTSKKRKVLSV